MEVRKNFQNPDCLETRLLILLWKNTNKRKISIFSISKKRSIFNLMNFIEILLFGILNINPDSIRSGKYGCLVLLRLSPTAKKMFRKSFWLVWSACHEKSYLTNLEIRNLKSEISSLCSVWLSQFCLFWKKMGKGFVNIPKFVNSTHNKYLFLWHADHIRWKNCLRGKKVRQF